MIPVQTLCLWGQGRPRRSTDPPNGVATVPTPLGDGVLRLAVDVVSVPPTPLASESAVGVL